MTLPALPAVLAPELGKYRLIAELARGGMGNVYLAVAQGPGGFHKLLVVKELRPEFADDETYVGMFLEEARLAARLAHPNVVQTNEVGSDGSRHYMIMEYLDGRSLHRVAKHLARAGGWPVGAHLRVIADALRGLHYAHEVCGFDGEPLGIVHRDVSPLNVLVTFDGQVKVLDFGIAKAVDSSLETQAGIVKGRIAYMAPEQACGGRVDRRADVYAAGVMIWEAAARRRLWPCLSDVEILRRALNEHRPRLRSVDPSAPADLDALCARAMAGKPSDRHPTAAALLEDLEAHLRRRDDAMSMHDVGAAVRRAFQPERLRMSALIDDALTRMGGVPSSGVMPARPPVAGTPGTSDRGSPGDLVSMSSLLAATPSSQRSAERSVRSVSAFRSQRPTVHEVAERPRPSLRRAAIAAGAVLAGASLAIAVLLRGVHAPRTDVAEPVARPESAVPAPSQPRAVDRDLPAPSSATPPPGDSRLTGALPIAAPRWTPPPAPRPPRSASTEAARLVPATPTASAGPAHAARPEVDPGGGRAPLHPIVTSNPYGDAL